MRKIKRLLKYLIIAGLILFTDTVIYEPYILKTISYNLTNPLLSGLRIVFVSDFHIAPYSWEEWRLKRIIAAINKENPDLVILGGDYVNGFSRKRSLPAENIVRALQRINAPKIAVLGNHDSYYGKKDVLTAFENTDIPVLENRNIRLNLHGREIYVAGVSDNETDTPDVEKALDDAGRPLIFVSHSPDVLVHLQKDVDVSFAGHTHGGQVVLPFLGAAIVNIKSGRKYTYGLLYENGKPMIVSSGL